MSRTGLNKPPVGGGNLFASFARPSSSATVDADIRDLSTLWYAIAALQGVLIAFLVGFGRIPIADLGDPFVYAVGGYFIRSRKSRAVAIVLLLFALGAGYMTIQARTGHGEGGRNVFLALIVVLLGCRTVMVSWFYQRHMGAKVRWSRVLWISALVAVVCVILDVVTVVTVKLTVKNLSDEDFGAILFSVPLILVPLLLGSLTRKWPFAVLQGPIGSSTMQSQATPTA